MKYNNTINWILRCLVSGLFILSAILKLYPIEAFEKQLVDLGFVNWCIAPIFARSIIAFELFLGLAFLQNHFFKKFIIAITAGMLLVFIMHLSWQINLYGNEGNCGCMGQKLPMTPLQAIIKNIITLIIIAIIYFKTPSKKDSKHRYPFIIMAAAAGYVFMSYPSHCCCDTNAVANPFQYEETNDSTTTEIDTTKPKTETIIETKKGDSTVIKPEPKLKRVMSDFTKYIDFNGKKVNLNDGKKIICVFNTDCDHCMGIAKKITAIANKTKLPPIYILFWSENNSQGEDLNKEITKFFNFSGSSHPYTMITQQAFFPLLGKHSGPPRIAVLNEGNMMGDFSEGNFEEGAFLKAVK